MNTAVKLATASVTLAVMASLFATSAEACGISNLGQVAVGATALARAVTVPGASAQGLSGVHLAAQASGNGSSGLQGHGNIVGMWSFTLTVATPDGPLVIDWGFQQWHSDNTELTNSGGHPADVGNFCMGAWAQQGDGQYKVNHWAIAWNPPVAQPNPPPNQTTPPFMTTQSFFGLINIHEVVSVDSTGNTMSGSFSEDLYDQTGTVFQMHLGDGSVSATRVTAD